MIDIMQTIISAAYFVAVGLFLVYIVIPVFEFLSFKVRGY